MTSIEEFIKSSIKKDSFVIALFRIIQEKNLDEVEVYKKAFLDRRYFSKLRNNINYKPSKKNVCALALALELSNAEAKQLIKKAGYILSSTKKYDLVIRYCFENKIYNLFEVNELLDKEGLETF